MCTSGPLFFSKDPDRLAVLTVWRWTHTHPGFVASVGAEVVGQKGDTWEECSGKVGAGSWVRLAGGAQWEGGGPEPGEAGRQEARVRGVFPQL